MYAVIFFFFQAEDGIRDLTVTGVQTCALPICVREDLRHRGLDRRELRARALLVAEDVEEDARDLVLRALVPRRRERPAARPHRAPQPPPPPGPADRPGTAAGAAGGRPPPAPPPSPPPPTLAGV